MNRITAIRQHHIVAAILDQHRVAFVFWTSAIFGLGLALLRPAWQVAVEPGQVLAGIVQYPPDNPFYIYQIKLWTILHQISAVLLYAGVSEISLSIFFNGVAGALSVSALAVWILALSDEPLFAILAAPFITMILPDELGIRYPVLTMGSTHTYGMIGLSAIMLAIGLLAAGEYKWGSILTGIAPAIHPSLGLWCNLLVLIALLLDFRNQRNSFKAAVPFLIIGYVVTAISLTLYWFMTRQSFIPSDPKIASDYLSAFVLYWDAHRRPIGLFARNIFLIMFGVFFSLTWAIFFKNDLRRNSKLLLIGYAVSGILGVVASVIHQMPPEQVPGFLLVLMPLRMMNLNTLGYFPLLFGLLWNYRHHTLTLLVLVITIPLLYMWRGSTSAEINILLTGGAILFITSRYQPSPLLPYLFFCGFFLVFIVFRVSANEFLSTNPRWIRVIIAIPGGILAGVTIVWLAKRLSQNKLSSLFNLQIPTFNFPTTPIRKVAQRIIIPLMLASLTILPNARLLQTWQIPTNTFKDRSNDPFYAEVSRRTGLLATGTQIHLIQLYTRRPILLDVDSLDLLPYTLEVGPELNRIMKVVYGTDLFNPPPTGLHRGTLPSEPARTVWQSRSIEEWRSIKRDFGVTDLLTEKNWKLNLPEVTRNEQFILYQIP
jgi:hypothetical protein